MKMQQGNFLNISIGLLALGAFVYVLYIGASIIIPFILALLLSFLILSISDFYKRFKIPSFICFILSLLTIGGVIYFITLIINANVGGIVEKAPEYQEKLMQFAYETGEEYGVDRDMISSQLVDKVNIPSIVQSTAGIATMILKNAGMILFFTIFILLESKAFKYKLSLITGGQKSSFFRMFEEIQSDIKSYFMIKSIVSMLVGVFSGIIMAVLGVEFFAFWAFLIFLLNYIPNIGSFIAVMFPVVFTLAITGSPYLTGVLLILLTAVQVVMGSLVEPRLMGNKLNLSPLVILISLIFWGTLWGAIGMILSVPIMVVINIILSNIEETKPLAILMSERGFTKYEHPLSPKQTRDNIIKNVKKLF